MRERRKWRYGIGGFLLFVWLVYGIMVALDLLDVRRVQRANLNDHLVAGLDSLAWQFHQVDGVLAALTRALEATSAAAQPSGARTLAAWRLAQRDILSQGLTLMPNVSLLTMLASDGAVALAAGLNPRRFRALAQHGDRLVDGHRADPELGVHFFTPPVEAGVTPDYLLASRAFAPRDDGSRPYVLVALMPTRELADWLARFSRSTHSHVILGDHHGREIARTRGVGEATWLDRPFVAGSRVDPEYGLRLDMWVTWGDMMPTLFRRLGIGLAAMLLISISLVVMLRKLLAQDRQRQLLIEEMDTVLELVQQGVCVVTADGTLQYANRHLLEMTGWRLHELRGRNLYEALQEPGCDARAVEACPIVHAIASGEDAIFADVALQRRDGSRLTGEIHVRPLVQEGHAEAAVVSIGDVTEHRLREARLTHDAHHDGLTGLPNRKLLMQSLEACLTERREHPERPGIDALAFIDLDGFKPINDRFGHETGDAVLRCVAERLQHQARDSDLVARQGGDEFVVLFRDMPDAATLERRARHMLDHLGEPMVLDDGETIGIGASIGLAPGVAAPDDVSTWLQRADIAMYRAKQAGKNRVVMYSPGD